MPRVSRDLESDHNIAGTCRNPRNRRQGSWTASVPEIRGERSVDVAPVRTTCYRLMTRMVLPSIVDPYDDSRA